MALINSFIRRLEKSSTTPGETPTIAPSADHTDGSWSARDIYPAELFVNKPDKKVYTSNGEEIFLINSGLADPISWLNKVENILPTLPVSPVNGQRILLASSAETHANEIAEYKFDDWVYTTPTKGDTVVNSLVNDILIYDGTSWIIFGGAGVSNSSSWLAPCDMGPLQTPPGFPSEGMRVLLGNSCSGAFTDHDNEIATYIEGSWSFTLPHHCDVTAVEDRLYQYSVNIEGWKVRMQLGDVLAINNETQGIDIEISEPSAVAFRNNGHLMRLIGQDIAEDHEVIMPAGSGTLALTTDIPPSSSEDLQAVLVNGNETLGRSVQISENDGVNWLQGANMVRVKAPAAITALRTLLWPDKSGTVATTDDVAAASDGMEPAIAAGTAAQYWRGDKTWQALDKGAVGLANVDNTADVDKPVSTAQAAAIAAAIDALVTGAPGALDTLNELAAALGDDPNFAATVTALVATKENALAAGTSTQYYRGDKTWQSLASAVAATPAVTANTAKVTNATHTGDVTGATALTIANGAVTNIKAAPMPANTLKGNNTGSTANQVDLTVAQTKVMLALDAVDNTSDANKPVSTAQAAALVLKAPLASPALTGTPTAPTAPAGTNNTQVATTAYADAALVAEVADRNNAIAAAVEGRDCYRGTYDASTNLFPAAGGSGLAGAVMMSDYWLVSVAGVLGGDAVKDGDIIHALSNGPGQTASLWYLDTARQVASTLTIEDGATTNDQDIVTPVKFWQGWAKGLTLSSFAASVRSILLTGYTIGTNVAIAATDTIMGALGNLQAQINNKANEKLTVTTVTATNYTATAANAGQSNLLLLNNAAAIAFTIPSNATLALPTGTAINCVQGGAGTVTLTPDAGVTLLSRGGALKTAGQYAFASAVKVGGDTWIITGDITL